MDSISPPNSLGPRVTTSSQLIRYRQVQAQSLASSEHLRDTELARLRPWALRYAIASRLDDAAWEHVYRLSLEGQDIHQVLDQLAQHALESLGTYTTP
jgi:hypothetical protein